MFNPLSRGMDYTYERMEIFILEKWTASHPAVNGLSAHLHWSHSQVNGWFQIWTRTFKILPLSSQVGTYGAVYYWNCVSHMFVAFLHMLGYCGSSFPSLGCQTENERAVWWAVEDHGKYTLERKEWSNMSQPGPEGCWVDPEGKCCIPASDCALLLHAVIFGLSQHCLNEDSQPVQYSLCMAMRLVRPQNWSYHCGKVNTNLILPYMDPWYNFIQPFVKSVISKKYKLVCQKLSLHLNE
jgi:hypothetical protein